MFTNDFITKHIGAGYLKKNKNLDRLGRSQFVTKKPTNRCGKVRDHIFPQIDFNN